MSAGTTAGTAAETAANRLADDEHFARNLIGGRWQFPAAPYDFEIRNPADSTVTTVVPLSSRFDVDRAVLAARNAAREAGWRDPAARVRVLRRIVDRLESHQQELADLQATETGLSEADSRRAAAATAAIARGVLRRGELAAVSGSDQGDCAAGADPGADCEPVSGHVLSWGLPLTEIVTSALPAMLRGEAVVVKPSLRGALSPIAFALLAHGCGLPPGVLNVVQGTGVDVGSALLGRPGLRSLHVRANSRTRAQGRRAVARTGVPLHEISAGGNIVVVGPGALDDDDLDGLVGHIAAATRLHAGAFALPTLALHDQADPRIANRLIEALADTVAAPLPTQPVRARAVARIAVLDEAGAETLLGSDVPDDVIHRMGWRIPPTVLNLGPAGSAAARREQHTEPLGPVVSILSWSQWADLQHHVADGRRYASGVTVAWGADPSAADSALAHAGRRLRSQPTIDGRDVRSWPDCDALADDWTRPDEAPGAAPLPGSR